jgi:hypothetical protein
VDRAQIEALLGKIDIWLLVFGIIVVVGVAGESFFGIRHWWNSRQLQAIQRADELNLQAEIARLNKQAGDAFERASKAEENLAGTNARAADANERAAKAEQAAAEANRTAEEERLARIKIEQRMADRDITGAQREKLLETLRMHAGEPVTVDSLLSEGREAFTYAGKIATVFRSAGWNVSDPRGMHSFSRPLSGVLIDVRKDDVRSKELGEFIAQAFTAAGISFSGNVEANVDAGTVLILIGGK